MVKSNLDALAPWVLKSSESFFFRIDFREKEFNWKTSCKIIRIWWFCNPSKTYQSLVEKLFGPMSFEEKIMGGNKIKNVLIISEAKLRLMSPLCIKVVQNTPPIHCLIMMGHLLAMPEGYAHYNNAKRNVVLLLQSHWWYANHYLYTKARAWLLVMGINLQRW